MKRFSEQFKKSAHELTLSVNERRDLKSRVVSYVEYHPISDLHTKNVHQFSLRRKKHLGIGFLRSFYARGAMGVFAVLLIMAGIPVVAEQAMPGEVLYPIKVRFNEEVRGTLARSPYEKVAWETERLERRLAEARVLENTGKLTPQAEAEVAAAVKQHSQAAQMSIDSIREQDSDAAAIAEITLSSALEVQSEMLEGRSETLSGAVDAAHQVATASHSQSRPSYERLVARIEIETTSAYELFDAIKEQTSKEDKEDIDKRLKNINQASANAEALKNTNLDEAVIILSTALADTRKVISFMSNIHVRENVSLDELVPVELNSEEIEALVRERINSVRIIEAEVTARIENVDVNTRTAIEDQLILMAAELENASSSMSVGDIEAADTASQAAHTIATKLIEVLDQYDIEMGKTASSTDAAATSTTTATTTSDSAASSLLVNSVT